MEDHLSIFVLAPDYLLLLRRVVSQHQRWNVVNL